MLGNESTYKRDKSNRVERRNLKMKLRCNKCKKWFDYKESWIILQHAWAVGTSVYAYCSEECAKEAGEQK